MTNRRKFIISAAACGLLALTSQSQAAYITNLNVEVSLYTDIPNRSFSSRVTSIRCLGYAVIGDNGGALYTRYGALMPSTPGRVQSKDGTWWILSESLMTPQMFGVCGQGGDDSAVFTKLYNPGLFGDVYIPKGTYIVEDIAISRNTKGAGPNLTILKHKSNSSTVLGQLTNSPKINNLTFDGNRTNQSLRVTMLTADGDYFSFDNVTFKSSIYSSLNFQDFVTASFNNCLWTDLAYHGGTVGQQTMAVTLHASDKAQANFTSCKFINLQEQSLMAPGGVLASDQNISMTFIGNYFYRFGQGQAGNYIGCIDAYERGIDNIVVGNTFEEICYCAVKSAASKSTVVTGNTVNGASSNDNEPWPAIFIGSRTGFGVPLKIVVSNNTIGGVFGTNISGIEVYGLSDIKIVSATIEGNIITSTKVGILSQNIEKVKIINNDVEITSTDSSIQVNQAPLATIDIKGNTIRNANGIPIRVDNGCTNGIVDISNNFLRTGTVTVPIKVDDVALAKVSNNTIISFPAASAITITNIVGSITVVGNMATSTVSLATSGIGGATKDALNTWNP